MDYYKLNGLVLILLTQVLLCLSQNPVITTNYGSLKGDVKEFNGKQFTTFFGISYAAPPVGDLRFRPTQRHEGWGDTIRDALEHGPSCTIQPTFFWNDPTFPTRLFIQDQSEDCLLLDIYISGDVSNIAERSLPVMVFIHGGGLISGSSLFEIGDAFVTDAQPIVMVTIQYRLGILGFLTTGDDVISGNNGLKDQSFALKWVQENIANFGGDPDRVTITGQSAGGASILAHMISPMSDGLFHRACAQSSPAGWLYPRKEVLSYRFYDYARSQNCLGQSQEAVDCLRTKSWQDIVASQASAVSTGFLSQPVIDGEFITDEPRNLWSLGQYNDAELMFGFTSDDGKYLIDFLNYADPEFDFAMDRSKDEELAVNAPAFVLPYSLADDKTPGLTIKRYGQDLTNVDDLSTVIKARYYDTADDPIGKARGLLDMSRDGFFAVYSLWIANQVAKNGGHVYGYIFDHSTEFLALNQPGGVPIGALHGHDLPYQFGYGLTDADTIPMTPDEIALTHSVIQAWTSFAAGDASYLTMSGDNVRWPKYTLKDRNLLTFDTDMSVDSANDRDGEKWQNVLDFWLAIDSLAQWDVEDINPPYPPSAASAIVSGVQTYVAVLGALYMIYVTKM